MPETDPQPTKSWSWRRFWRNAALIAAAITLALVGWNTLIKPHVIPKNLGVVEAGIIYRSGELTPATIKKVVDRHGIRTIIDLGAHDLPSPGETREQRTADALGVDRVRLPLFGDATGDPNHYLETLRIMTDPSRQPVLVHCAAGAQRTGAAVGLYRIIEQGWSIDQAIDEAMLYRHDPASNPHLREMLEQWAAPIAEALRDGGSITYTGPARTDLGDDKRAP